MSNNQDKDKKLHISLKPSVYITKDNSFITFSNNINKYKKYYF